MKTTRIVTTILVLVLAMVMAVPALADKPVQFDSEGNEVGWSSTGCAKISSGTITDSFGNTLQTGFDEFGYNYQAHLFLGTYDSSDRQWGNGYWGDQTSDYVDDVLMMKWSDEWLANVDCNGDGKLDRGLVNGTVGGISKCWITNHVFGDYPVTEADEANYVYFVKIGYTGPGSPLWGSYTEIQSVYNDPAAGETGLYYMTEPGLGTFVQH